MTNAHDSRNRSLPQRLATKWFVQYMEFFN